MTWRNDDGWSLDLMAFDGSMFGDPAPGGQITIHKVSGIDVWTTQDYSSMDPCVVTTDEVSVDGVSGSATCRAVRWVDGLANPGAFGEPVYIEGQEPFDAEVTFEAH